MAWVGGVSLLLTAVFAWGDLLEKIGRFDHESIREASGIVQSTKHRGTFWVHNDSGNEPRIFAVKSDGSLIAEFTVAAPNIDWEAIAIDDKGHLWIADIGNNSKRLPRRAIYQIDEPDPDHPAKEPLQVRQAIRYAAPPEGAFDAEAIFLRGNRLFVIAKTLDRREAQIYEIALDQQTTFLKPAIPKQVGVLEGFVEPVTDACLEPSGKRLAVCAIDAVRVYKLGKDDSWKLIATVAYPNHGIEAVCWDKEDLILASEDRTVFRLAATRWQKSTK